MGLRITKVYTRQGDDGETRLGGGQIVSKDSTRTHAYGTVDELNSTIGAAIAFKPTSKVEQALIKIQHELFTLGGDFKLPEGVYGAMRQSTEVLALVLARKVDQGFWSMSQAVNIGRMVLRDNALQLYKLTN